MLNQACTVYKASALFSLSAYFGAVIVWFLLLIHCVARLLLFLHDRSGSLKVIENVYPTATNRSPRTIVKATLQGSGTWVDGKVLVQVDDKRQVRKRFT